MNNSRMTNGQKVRAIAQYYDTGTVIQLPDGKTSSVWGIVPDVIFGDFITMGGAKYKAIGCKLELGDYTELPKRYAIALATEVLGYATDTGYDEYYMEISRRYIRDGIQNRTLDVRVADWLRRHGFHVPYLGEFDLFDNDIAVKITKT